MERFFDDLRVARESLGVSLETISAATKVSRRHLEALELGMVSTLPSGVFRKGIVRGYVSTLGLDAEPWMERFEHCLAAMGEQSLPPVDLEQIAEGVQRSRGDVPVSSGLRWPGVFAMVALLLAFGWFVWRFALRGHVTLSWRPVAIHETSRLEEAVPARAEAGLAGFERTA